MAAALQIRRVHSNKCWFLTTGNIFSVNTQKNKTSIQTVRGSIHEHFLQNRKKKKKSNHVLSVSTMPNAASMMDNIQLKISFIHKIWIAYLMILVIQKLPNKVLEKQSATMVSASTIRFLECL